MKNIEQEANEIAERHGFSLRDSMDIARRNKVTRETLGLSEIMKKWGFKSENHGPFDDAFFNSVKEIVGRDVGGMSSSLSKFLYDKETSEYRGERFVFSAALYNEELYLVGGQSTLLKDNNPFPLIMRADDFLEKIGDQDPIVFFKENAKRGREIYTQYFSSDLKHE